MIIPRRLVFVLGAFSLTACVDKAEILILEPSRAAMLAKGQQVTVKIQGTADQVTINGATTITDLKRLAGSWRLDLALNKK